jgi:hypothetical protein
VGTLIFGAGVTVEIATVVPVVTTGEQEEFIIATSKIMRIVFDFIFTLV